MLASRKRKADKVTGGSLSAGRFCLSGIPTPWRIKGDEASPVGKNANYVPCVLCLRFLLSQGRNQAFIIEIFIKPDVL